MGFDMGSVDHQPLKVRVVDVQLTGAFDREQRTGKSRLAGGGGHDGTMRIFAGVMLNRREKPGNGQAGGKLELVDDVERPGLDLFAQNGRPRFAVHQSKGTQFHRVADFRNRGIGFKELKKSTIDWRTN